MSSTRARDIRGSLPTAAAGAAKALEALELVKGPVVRPVTMRRPARGLTVTGCRGCGLRSDVTADGKCAACELERAQGGDT